MNNAKLEGYDNKNYWNRHEIIQSKNNFDCPSSGRDDGLKHQCCSSTGKHAKWALRGQ